MDFKDMSERDADNSNLPVTSGGASLVGRGLQRLRGLSLVSDESAHPRKSSPPLIDILVPDLVSMVEQGWDVDKWVLAKWHVKVGDAVSIDDVIFDIETNKCILEVCASHEGEIAELLFPEGTVLCPEGANGVKSNTPIARLIGTGGA